MEKVNIGQVLEKLREYGDRIEPFTPGVTYIHVDDSVSNGDESVNLMMSILGMDSKDFLKSFTVKMMDYFGQGRLSITGGGLSSHLLVMQALSSPQLKTRSVKKGDEIITTSNSLGVISACRLFGVTPVIVDVDLNTMLPNPVSVEMMIVEGKTKAIILPSVCGSSVDGEVFRDVADDFSILLIEDIGYGFGGWDKHVPLGNHADLALFSWHSRLLGDAGVIVSKSHLIHELLETSIKSTDTEYWMGLSSNKLMYSYLSAQMDKHEYYSAMRRVNWKRLHDGLYKFSKWFRFQKAVDGSSPSWTGFMITLKEPCPFTKQELMEFLENNKIGTRHAVGNVFQVDVYKPYIRDGEELMNSDYIHRNSFIVGCNPNMRQEHTDWIINTVEKFMEKYDGKEETKD